MKVKKPTSIEEQIDKIEKRGCDIGSRLKVYNNTSRGLQNTNPPRAAAKPFFEDLRFYW